MLSLNWIDFISLINELISGFKVLFTTLLVVWEECCCSDWWTIVSMIIFFVCRFCNFFCLVSLGLVLFSDRHGKSFVSDNGSCLIRFIWLDDCWLILRTSTVWIWLNWGFSNGDWSSAYWNEREKGGETISWHEITLVNPWECLVNMRNKRESYKFLIWSWLILGLKFRVSKVLIWNPGHNSNSE